MQGRLRYDDTMVHGIILYKYMPWEAFEKTIENWSLKATYPTKTNDPLEFIAQDDDDIDFVEYFRAPSTPLPYFHSFSSKVTDVAMWGRYADSARGVCLAFGFPLDEKNEVWNEKRSVFYKTFSELIFFKVKYSDERVKFKFDIHNIEEKAKLLSEVLSTKAKCWSDECEFRFIDQLKDADYVAGGNVYYKKYMQYLCGVILGERCLYNVEYVKKLFGQYRKKMNVPDGKLLNNAISLTESDFQNKKEFDFDIHFVQSEVHPKRFEIVNNVFYDNMKLEEFLKIK